MKDAIRIIFCLVSRLIRIGRKKLKLFFRLLIVLFMIIILSTKLTAVTDSVNHPITEITAFIGHLNYDCIQDTIICKRIATHFWMPRIIKWGRSDTTKCPALFPDSIIVKKTYIEYPDSTANYFSSFYIEKVNQDSVFDMVFRVRWTYYDTTRKIARDTLRYICIFGQNELMRIDTIKIKQLDTIVNSPFIARELTFGSTLDSLIIYKTYNYISYTSDTIYISIANPGKIMPTDLNETTVYNGEELKISIYPNPSSDEIFIRILSNKSADYNLFVSDLLGNKRMEDILRLQEGTELKKPLNISNLPNGLFTLVIQGQQIKEIKRFIKIK